AIPFADLASAQLLRMRLRSHFLQWRAVPHSPPLRPRASHRSRRTSSRHDRYVLHGTCSEQQRSAPHIAHTAYVRNVGSEEDLTLRLGLLGQLSARPRTSCECYRQSSLDSVHTLPRKCSWDDDLESIP